MVVHSFINSIDPPGSALMSQIARSLCGSEGAPSEHGNQGACIGRSRAFAAGNVNRFGEPTAQYMPFIITEAKGAI